MTIASIIIALTGAAFYALVFGWASAIGFAVTYLLVVSIGRRWLS